MASMLSVKTARLFAGGASPDQEERLPFEVDAIVAVWERETGGLWDRRVGLVEVRSPFHENGTRIWLRLGPVETLTEVAESQDGAEFTALESTSYALQGRLLRRLSGTFAPYVRITYTGGYVETPPAVVPPAVAQHQTPHDIVQALVLQLQFARTRLSPDKLAVSSLAIESGQTTFLAADFHPVFLAAVKRHRRLA